jgi:Ser/Thr protein kinase RdoA (MazF antagonist)
MNDAPSTTHPFDLLTPDMILEAVESRGVVTDGRLLALNSYENRVYQVGIEDDVPLIAKFYRPERWSNEQIREEHQFIADLTEAELPVVAPLPEAGSEADVTLSTYQDFRFSLFPRKGGHAPELDNDNHIFILGRFLARLHNVGSIAPFQHRPTLNSQAFGHEAVAFVTEHFVPADLRTAYTSLTRDLLQAVDEKIASAGAIEHIRTHGDCHVGNVLWRDDNPHFIDLDDARMAPAIQDMWMLLSGDRDSQTRQIAEIIDGYEEFRSFNPRELHLIEPLRTLRMMHFAAWIGRRWDDPAFPKAFPWFNSPRYWGDEILNLRSQMAELNEPVLRLQP